MERMRPLLKSLSVVIVLCGILAVTVFAQNNRTITGAIDNTNPFAELAFTVSDPNTTITLDLKPTSGDLDTYLYLIDSNGNIIAENDDRQRGDISSLIVYPSAPTGTYRAIATRYGGATGNTSGAFELALSITPDVRIELQPYNVTPETLTASNFPTLEPRPQAEWTIIAYYGGDTNLELGVIRDMIEFEQAGGSTESVRVVMLLDRNYENTDVSGDWHTSKLYEVSISSTSEADTISSVELADLGIQRISGDGEFFAQYLAWAIRNYPAQNYAVAFASHGAAWEGLIQDDTPNPNDVVDSNVPDARDRLDLVELSSAFDIALSEAGVERFDLLVNDACSMSSIEYFSVMSRYFDVSIASPEVVIDPALNMTMLTEMLNANPDGDVLQYAQQLVDYYIDVDIRRFDSPDLVNLTHAVTDLTQFQAVDDAINTFADIFNRDPRTFSQAIGQIRNADSTYTYSEFLGSKTKIDLGTFMEGISENVTDPELRGAALDVIDALNAVRVYSRNGGKEELNLASYYNIYFPDDRSFFRQSDYFRVTPIPSWGELLRNYYNANNTSLASILGDTQDNFHSPIDPKVNITSVYPLAGTDASILAPVVMETEILGRNIAFVETTLDQVQADGSFIRLATERVLLDVPTDTGIERVNVWQPGVNSRQVVWDVMLPRLFQEDPSANPSAVGQNEWFVFTEEVAYLDGTYREPGGADWNDVTVIFNVTENFTTDIGRVQRVISRVANSESAADIRIPVGSEFVPYRGRVSADGVTILERSPNTFIWGENGLFYQHQPAPNATYNYGLLATAFGGSTGFANTVLMVDNDNLNVNLRADSAPFAGFTLPRFAPWSRIAYSLGDLEPYSVELYRTYSPDETQNSSVYVLSTFDFEDGVVPTDLNALLTRLVELSGFVLESEATPITYQDREALEFTYSYTLESGQVWRGTAFMIYDPNNQSGLTFSAEAIDGVDYSADYTLLKDQLVLTDVNLVFDAWNRNWRATFTNYGDFSRPVNWASSIATDTNEAFAPDGNPTSSIFFSVNVLANPDLALEGVTRFVAGRGAVDFVVGEQRAYTNATSWDSMSYTATRNNVAVIGRVYTTLDGAGQRIAVWFELPDDDQAQDIIINTLELMVDSFILAQ
jgi:hypothetical protein